MGAFGNAIFLFFVFPYILVIIPAFFLPGKWTSHDTWHGIKVTITCHVITALTIYILIGILPIFYWIGWYFYYIFKVASRPKTYATEEPPDLEKIMTTSEGNDVDQDEELQLGNGTSVPIEERAANMYIIGKAGYGKSKAMQFWFSQDVAQGRGAAVLDPHGDLIEDYFASLADEYYTRAKEKYGNDADKEGKVKEIMVSLEAEEKDSILKHIILIDPTNKKWAVGFNPIGKLEDVDSYKQALQLSDSLLDVWGFEATEAPVMSEVLQKVGYTLAENGKTLTETTHLLYNPAVQREMLAKIKNPGVIDFWKNRYPTWMKREPMRTESAVNKIRTFTDHPDIAPIIGQEKSLVDFRKAMDDGDIILFNLAKGDLTDSIANILGGLFLTYMHLAAMSRRNVSKAQRTPYYFYVDEFQTITSANFGSYLREDRKYGLHFVLANQDLQPLSEDVQSAIFGNVNIILTFRVSPDDALIMAKQLFRLTGQLTQSVQSKGETFGVKGYAIPTSRDEVRKHTIDTELKLYAEQIKDLPRRKFLFKYGEMKDPESDTTVTMKEIDREQEPIKFYIDELKDICTRRWARPKDKIMEEIAKRRQSVAGDVEHLKSF